MRRQQTGPSFHRRQIRAFYQRIPPRTILGQPGRTFSLTFIHSSEHSIDPALSQIRRPHLIKPINQSIHQQAVSAVHDPPDRNESHQLNHKPLTTTTWKMLNQKKNWQAGDSLTHSLTRRFFVAEPESALCSVIEKMSSWAQSPAQRQSLTNNQTGPIKQKIIFLLAFAMSSFVDSPSSTVLL